MLWEKNDKIGFLIVEFDMYCVDFRSILDSLEMVSVEIEWVYEE